MADECDKSAEIVVFERIWRISPAFDRRAPEPAKNYGVHGCELRMVLKGPLGATQFVLYTNWQLPHVRDEFDAKRGDDRWPHLLCHPQPADLGYHWSTPRYEGQGAMDCDLVPGGKCYYDGSSLNAEEIYKVLLAEGDEGVWKRLQEFYRDLENRNE